MKFRPKFETMWSNFSTVNGSVLFVGKKIGGKVGENIELGTRDTVNGFTNACAIRMSYALNYSGVKVGSGPWAKVSGADKNWYIFRVKDMLKFLNARFGRADKIVIDPKASDFAGLKGILAFEVSHWLDATGHLTLWNGTNASDHEFFGKASKAYLWSLG